jgi:hypothetical protein
VNQVRAVVTVLFLLAPLSAFSQLPPKTAPRQKPKQEVEAGPEMAAWNPEIGKLSGITQERFAELGLYKLTKQQFRSLLGILIEQEASEAARAVQNAPSYTCERIDSQKSAFDKVMVFLEFNDDGPPDFISGLRQKLRSISDVQIVFSEKESDVIVSVLASRTKLEDGRDTGYDASVVYSQSCRERYLNQDDGYSFRKLLGYFNYESGMDVRVIIEDVGAKLDTRAFESARKLNVIRKKNADLLSNGNHRL